MPFLAAKIYVDVWFYGAILRIVSPSPSNVDVLWTVDLERNRLLSVILRSAKLGSISWKDLERDNQNDEPTTTVSRPSESEWYRAVEFIASI